MPDYFVEFLPNGLIRVFDRSTRSQSCFYADGTLHSGSFRLSRAGLNEAIARQDEWRAATR